MSVSIEHLRTVEPLELDQLQTLHTGSLLTRLKKLRALHQSFDQSDWSPEERDAVAAAGLIAFKDTEVWKAAFAQIKEVLSTREHLPKRQGRRR